MLLEDYKVFGSSVCCVSAIVFALSFSLSLSLSFFLPNQSHRFFVIFLHKCRLHFGVFVGVCLYAEFVRQKWWTWGYCIEKRQIFTDLLYVCALKRHTFIPFARFMLVLLPFNAIFRSWTWTSYKFHCCAHIVEWIGFFFVQLSILPTAVEKKRNRLTNSFTVHFNSMRFHFMRW